MISLPVTDAVFLRGEGVFETIRADRGRPQLWHRHYERLQRSAGLIGWAVPSRGELANRMIEVLSANHLEAARVRVTLGEGVLIAAEELTDRPEGAEVVTSSVPVNERSPLAQVKGTSYAENMWLLRDSGADEVIRPNTRGDLCEGCISNLFFVRDGIVHTPSLATGCLPGVMRGQVMKLIEVKEGRWPVGTLREAEEIWLSNAISRLRYVRRLDGRGLDPSARRPPVFARVAEGLAEACERS